MTTDPYSQTVPLIAASILSADFSKLGEDTVNVLREGADLIHLDVLDGHFAPNISFGIPVIRSLRKVTPAFFDTHLMISEPLRYAERFCQAGADGLTFHIEAVTDPRDAVRQVRGLGCRVGIALNPATPVEAILPVIEHVDLVLVMSVVPGFSGQKFMPEVLQKARRIADLLRPDQRMEMDGGLSEHTMPAALAAGTSWFVAASSIFDAPDRPAAIQTLHRALGRQDNGRDHAR